METFHVGSLIKGVFCEQGRSVEWFAKQMGYNRTNVYKMFEKQHLNTEVVARASKVLNHVFFSTSVA